MEYPLLKKIIEWLVHQYERIEGHSRITKLLYLAENAWYLENGSTYTEATFVRGYSLPFSKEVPQVLQWMDGIEVIECEKYDSHINYYVPGSRSRLNAIELNVKFKELMQSIADIWIRAPHSKLSDYLYTIESFDKANIGDQLFPIK